MNALIIRFVLAGALVVLSFTTGWKTKGWKDDSEAAATERAVAKAVVAYRATERNIAVALEDKLKDLKANERLVERETIKLVDRPVYRNECLDADGLRLIERARRSGKADSGEPDTEVR